MEFPHSTERSIEFDIQSQMYLFKCINAQLIKALYLFIHLHMYVPVKCMELM